MVTKTSSEKYPPQKSVDSPRHAHGSKRIKARREGGFQTHPSLIGQRPSKPSGDPAAPAVPLAPQAGGDSATHGLHQPPDSLGKWFSGILRPPGLAGGNDQLTHTNAAPTSGQLGAPLLCPIRCAPGSSKAPPGVYRDDQLTQPPDVTQHPSQIAERCRSEPLTTRQHSHLADVPVCGC